MCGGLRLSVRGLLQLLRGRFTILVVILIIYDVLIVTERMLNISGQWLVILAVIFGIRIRELGGGSGSNDILAGF